MPGPFPGMDPYLEGPAHWRGVHGRLISHLSDALNALLPLPYAATVDERLRSVQPNRTFYPDLVIVDPPRSGPAPAGAGGGVLVAPEIDVPWRVTALPLELHEPFIEIVRADDPGN